MSQFFSSVFVNLLHQILYSQQLHNLSLIEADNRLAVDDRYRRALKAEIDQLFQRRLVRADVFLHELHALLR